MKEQHNLSPGGGAILISGTGKFHNKNIYLLSSCKDIFWK